MLTITHGLLYCGDKVSVILKNLKVSINDSWEIPSVKHPLTITSINVQESDHVELLAKTIDENVSRKTIEKKTL